MEMTSLRRLVAALSSALLLQLTLQASGASCAMHHAGGMQTHAAEKATMPSGCDQSSKGDGCGLPSAPGQCATMTSCTSAPVSPAAELVARVSLHASSPAIAEAMLLHSGPSAAPEIPPPRV
jgi:hypothetical protein